MGNCKSSSNNQKKYVKSVCVEKPVPSKYTLNQTQLIYEAVLNAYIRKKTIPEYGIVYMFRSGRAHISLPLLPGELPELNETYMSAAIKLLEDYFISIGVNHEIYINPSVDSPEKYKLYCHLTTFG